MNELEPGCILSRDDEPWLVIAVTGDSLTCKHLADPDALPTTVDRSQFRRAPRPPTLFGYVHSSSGHTVPRVFSSSTRLRVTFTESVRPVAKRERPSTEETIAWDSSFEVSVRNSHRSSTLRLELSSVHRVRPTSVMGACERTLGDVHDATWRALEAADAAEYPEASTPLERTVTALRAAAAALAEPLPAGPRLSVHATLLMPHCDRVTPRLGLCPAHLTAALDFRSWNGMDGFARVLYTRSGHSLRDLAAALHSPKMFDWMNRTPPTHSGTEGRLNSLHAALLGDCHLALAHWVRNAPELALEPDARGWTPLHLACATPGLLSTTLAMVGSPNVAADSLPVVLAATDHQGATPLMLAAAAGNSDAVLMLLPEARRLDARDHAGNTALHRAARGGLLSADAFAALLAASAGHVVEPDWSIYTSDPAMLEALQSASASASTDLPPTPPPVVRRQSSLEGPVDYDEDYEYDEDVPPPPPTLRQLSRQVSLRVLEPDESAAARLRQLGELAELLQLPISTVGVLLRQRQWDADGLTAAFFADRARVLEAAGLTQAAGGGLSPPHAGTCSVCWCDDDDMVSLACGHDLCGECWGGMLRAALQSGGALDATCAMPDCGEPVDEAAWRALADEASLDRYERLLLRSFVDLSPLYAWCPSPADCTCAVRVPPEGGDVACSCGFQFCASCLSEAHEPTSCAVWAAWKRDTLVHTDKASVEFMLAHYKMCPKCSVLIEKTGGCKHMTCTMAGCGHEWCQLCGANWQPEGYSHRCDDGVYQGDTEKPPSEWNVPTAEARDTLAASSAGTPIPEQLWARATMLTNAGDALASRVAYWEALLGELRALLEGEAGTAAPELPEGEPEHCTFRETGRRRAAQALFDCGTCSLRGQAAVCAACRDHCHGGHDVAPSANARGYCGCGARSGLTACRSVDQEHPDTAVLARTPSTAVHSRGYLRRFDAQPVEANERDAEAIATIVDVCRALARSSNVALSTLVSARYARDEGVNAAATVLCEQVEESVTWVMPFTDPRVPLVCHTADMVREHVARLARYTAQLEGLVESL